MALTPEGCRLSSVPTQQLHARRLVALALCVAAITAPSLAAGAGGGVVLGSKAFAPLGEGWGTKKPAKIFNGGDPSGLVTQINWTRWGGAVAIGQGRNPIFKPGGGYYSHQVRIKLRASAIGRCGGRRAYTRLSVREPSRPGGPLGPWRLWSGGSSICSAP